MKDCLGNELKVGDKVVYVHKFSKYGTALTISNIAKIVKLWGIETAYFTNKFYKGVQSTNLMKIKEVE